MTNGAMIAPQDWVEYASALPFILPPIGRSMTRAQIEGAKLPGTNSDGIER
jgi:hypothetical protein